LFRYSLLLVLSFVFGADVLADKPTHTLFAVDLTLSAEDKKNAIESIKETTLTSPQSHSIGLTLFDDTVRDFVAPARLEKEQLASLHQALINIPASVRSTSNFAVGIERAIDAFTPDNGANLVVFSRGVIDTESEDPRAQFIEWLEQVLLPQASDSNIAVSLVVQQNITTQKEIKEIKEIKAIFARSDSHRVIEVKAGTQIAQELIRLLTLSDRVRGGEDSSSAILLASDSTTADTQTVSDERSNTAGFVELSKVWVTIPLVRLVLLAISIALLISIVYWRYRANRVTSHDDPTVQKTSSYLPLSKKPNETMEDYINKETDLATKTKLRD